MLNKLYVSIVAGLALCAGLMLTPATATHAQSKNSKPQTAPNTTGPMKPTLPGSNKVALKCEPANSDVSAQVRVTNNTNQTIPKGTQIFAKNKAGLSSTLTLSSALTPNDYVKFTLGGNEEDARPCSAYYMKK
jgi:hypothetical protein